MKRVAKALLLVCLLTAAAVAQIPRYVVSGTLTNATSVVSIASPDYNLATVTIHGTHAGITVVFEFSDDGGATWYQDMCSRSDSALLETGEAVATNGVLSWDCGVGATTNFRVRATSWTSGSATVNITMTQAPIEPAPTMALAPQGATVKILNAAGAATTVKSGSGYVWGLSLINNNAAVVYVEFFNTTSPTLGSTTPTLVLVIPASSTLTVPPGVVAMVSHSTAISVAAVTAYNGSTAGSVTGSVLYQ